MGKKWENGFAFGLNLKIKLGQDNISFWASNFEKKRKFSFSPQTTGLLLLANENDSSSR